MSRRLTPTEYYEMSIMSIAEHHGMNQKEMFDQLYTEPVVVKLLRSNFADKQFNEFMYKVYEDWYNKNMSKLGKALK